MIIEGKQYSAIKQKYKRSCEYKPIVSFHTSWSYQGPMPVVNYPGHENFNITIELEDGSKTRISFTLKDAERIATDFRRYIDNHKDKRNIESITINK
jgi:hypothetical protein